MRFILLVVAALVIAMPATAGPPPALDERGIALPRPEQLPRRAYGWNTWLLGSDDLHVVVAEGEHLERPARYQAFDNGGRARWQADHACPNFDEFTTIFALEKAKGQPGRIICKWKRQIIAVDLATGKEAWRFSTEQPLYITAGAQRRVAVSVANRQLAVLDGADGREVLRIDTEGAVLEAVAATSAGPLALLVWDTPGRVKETIELAVGEGGALERVELSGKDPGRKLIAVPINGLPMKGKVTLSPLRPLWAAPFEGYSFEVSATAGAVVGQPREDVRAAWDLSDGTLLWERPVLEGELVFFGEDGGAFARRDERGGHVWGAMNARTLEVLWQKSLPAGTRPIIGGQGGGDVGLVTSGGFHLVRFKDGAERTALTVASDLELANLRSTPKSLLWVAQRDAERWLHFKVLPPR
jgi:hypothetical protein